MSTNRTARKAWVHPSKMPKGPNGRPLCRQCGTEVSGRRRTFCSDACVHAWKIVTDPGYVREQVFKRDRGVCALCGLDTEALRKVVRTPFFTGEPGTLTHRRNHPVKTMMDDLLPRNRTLWDADHVIPVVEGGGECDLDNYRTLCVWCHKRETAALAARLAERRRAERDRAQGKPPAVQLEILDA